MNKQSMLSCFKMKLINKYVIKEKNICNSLKLSSRFFFFYIHFHCRNGNNDKLYIVRSRIWHQQSFLKIKNAKKEKKCIFLLRKSINKDVITHLNRN